MNRPVYMPEHCTGAPGEWSGWVHQFELAAKVNAWGEDDKLTFMALLLKGQARDIYSGLTPKIQGNYQRLTEALTQHLDPPVHADWGRAAFLDRTRQVGEPLRDLGYEIRRLATKAYPAYDPGTQDSLAKDHFIAQVGSGELRIQLRSAKPKTLEEAINLASELDQIHELERKDSIFPRIRLNTIGPKTQSYQVSVP
nr:PREDICTED: uncharacterized protein LOC106702805 [Latimeria chalumnae]|eukprot:XP_014341586.1 PREDICTED: uncharacterized protein LOC106702805 [Latimeria chalumnae]